MTAAVSQPIPEHNLSSMANAIRALSMDAVEHAKSGHPGMPMGMADVATVLFSKSTVKSMITDRKNDKQ